MLGGSRSGNTHPLAGYALLLLLVGGVFGFRFTNLLFDGLNARLGLTLLLATLFSLTSFISYLEFRRGRKGRFKLLAGVLGLCAILANAAAFSLPLLFIAYELLLRRHERCVRYAVGFLPISVIGVIPAYWMYLSQSRVGTGIPGEFLPGTLYPSYFAAPLLLAAAVWVGLAIGIWRWGGEQLRFWYTWLWICFLPVSIIVQ